MPDASSILMYTRIDGRTGGVELCDVTLHNTLKPEAPVKVQSVKIMDVLDKDGTPVLQVEVIAGEELKEKAKLHWEMLATREDSGANVMLALTRQFGEKKAKNRGSNPYHEPGRYSSTLYLKGVTANEVAGVIAPLMTDQELAMEFKRTAAEVEPASLNNTRQPIQQGGWTGRTPSRESAPAVHGQTQGRMR